MDKHLISYLEFFNRDRTREWEIGISLDKSWRMPINYVKCYKEHFKKLRKHEK